MPAPLKNPGQIRHPITGRWVLLDLDTGRVVKTRVARWPDTKIIKQQPEVRV